MDRYEYDIERVCQVVKPLFDKVPPNIFGKSPEDLADTRRAGRRTCAASSRRSCTTSSGCSPAAPPTSSTTTSRATSSRATSRRPASSAPRSARCRRAPGLVLLFHSMGEHDGHFGSWAFHKGGNGGFTQVLARAAQAYGAEIMLNAAGRLGDHQGGPGRRRRARGRHRVHRQGRGQRARPATYVHPARRAARAAQRPGREHQPATSSRARRPRSTSRSTALPRYPALGDRTRPVPRLHQHRAVDRVPRAGLRRREVRLVQPAARTSTARIQSIVDPDMAPPGKHVMSLLRPVRAVPPQGQRLGHRAARTSATPCSARSSRSSPASATSCCSARSSRRSTSSGWSG